VFQIEQFSGQVMAHSFLMRMIDMAPKLFLDVPCPTCGVTSGNRCVLHSGGLRSEPHVDRKLCAVEAVKAKRIHRINLR